MSDMYVGFRYHSTKNGKTKTCTLSAEEFICRFLQHVLPKGFVKVRFYGFFNPRLRTLLKPLRKQLDGLQPSQTLVDGESQPLIYPQIISCALLVDSSCKKRKSFLLMYQTSLTRFALTLSLIGQGA